MIISIVISKANSKSIIIMYQLSLVLVGEIHPNTNCIIPIKAKINGNDTTKPFFRFIIIESQINIVVATIIALLSTILNSRYLLISNPIPIFSTRNKSPIIKTVFLIISFFFMVKVVVFGYLLMMTILPHLQF